MILASECSFSYFALVMSHFTCLHLVLPITAGSKRRAHVKLPLSGKLIAGRHNVLNGKHRAICRQLIKYLYCTSSTRSWKESPYELYSSAGIKKIIITKNSPYSLKPSLTKILAKCKWVVKSIKCEFQSPFLSVNGCFNTFITCS